VNMKAIVTGMIATYPVAGVAWDYGQYALGLERLGFQVYYLEDSGLASYHEEPALYLARCLACFSPQLARQWHYRAPDGSAFGLPADEFAEVVAEAALFVNVSGGCLMRDEYLNARNRIFIDTDPGLNHFVNFPKWDAAPGWQGTHGYRAHDHFFTYAENIGKPSCKLPDLGLPWRTTRPPVVLDLWQTAKPSSRWTTIMSWQPFQHYRRQGRFDASNCGAKEIEFEKFTALPKRVAATLEVAVGGAQAPVEEWRDQGWRVIDAAAVSGEPDVYREYIQHSRGEVSVAKNVYVATHCGWFSCRSVCYLAAGLPVVVQDTGFSEVIATGEGLRSFSTLEEAADAIEAVEGDYRRHQDAAREIASSYFASDLVLQALLKEVGLCTA
jgi:hypothetical protein